MQYRVDYAFNMYFSKSTFYFVSTERFTDLGKLKLKMVVWFKVQADFQYCPSRPIKWCSIQKCQNRLKNNHLASLI